MGHPPTGGSMHVCFACERARMALMYILTTGTMEQVKSSLATTLRHADEHMGLGATTMRSPATAGWGWGRRECGQFA